MLLISHQMRGYGEDYLTSTDNAWKRYLVGCKMKASGCDVSQGEGVSRCKNSLHARRPSRSLRGDNGNQPITRGATAAQWAWRACPSSRAPDANSAVLRSISALESMPSSTRSLSKAASHRS